MIDAESTLTRRQRLARHELGGHALLDHLLLYRLVIVNLIGAVGIGFAFQRGWVMPVLDGDSTRIVYVIIALFLGGIVSLFIRALKVSATLNALKRGETPEVNGTKVLEKAAHLDDVSNWLVTLGLLGTVIGISIALFGVDQASLNDPEGVKRVVTGLIAGMQVALYTTIVGAVFGLWIDINRRMLKTATVLMIEDAVDAGIDFTAEAYALASLPRAAEKAGVPA